MAAKDESTDRTRDEKAGKEDATGSPLDTPSGESPAWATGAAPATGLAGTPVEHDPQQLGTEQHTVVQELAGTENPNYQRAGQARQIAGELENLEAYGAGDGGRARALRRTLESLGIDPSAEVSSQDDPRPTGRTTRQEKMTRTQGSNQGRPVGT